MNKLIGNTLAVLLGLTIFLAAKGGFSNTGSPAPGREMARQATKGEHLWITADHRKHEVLKKPFTSGPQVTQACLTCHTEAALQFHKTIHWTWKDPSSSGKNQLGKGGLSINNF